MADYTSEFRTELNKRAIEIINFLVEQNPSKVYWTNDELFEKLKENGFNSKRDVAFSMQALCLHRRVIWLNNKATRVYLLKQLEDYK